MDFWVWVQEEAHESGIIDVVGIDTIVVPLPVHLKPHLVPRAEVQQDRAARLVNVVCLELIVGEDHRLVLLVEADLDIRQVDCQMVGEVVCARDAAEELAGAGIVVALLVVEDLAEADGDVGVGGSLLQPHAEGRAVDEGTFALLPLLPWVSGKSSRSFLPWSSYFALVTFGALQTWGTEWGRGAVCTVLAAATHQPETQRGLWHQHLLGSVEQGVSLRKGCMTSTSPVSGDSEWKALSPPWLRALLPRAACLKKRD